MHVLARKKVTMFRTCCIGNKIWKNITWENTNCDKLGAWLIHEPLIHRCMYVGVKMMLATLASKVATSFILNMFVGTNFESIPNIKGNS
jgi:hypothetical protein